MGETAQQDIRLFFGLTKLDGSAIGNADWASFLAETVTPRFPDGLTLYETAGQWRDRTGDRIIRQPSRVIEIVSPPGARAQSAIEAIRSAYRSRFNQQSVGLVVSTACASF